MNSPFSHTPLSAERLYTCLRDNNALIVSDGRPPYRAVADGDMRRRPIAWIDTDTLDHWRSQGLLRTHKKGWELLSRPGPRPILAETVDGTRHVEVRESWMQRLARDLDLDGPLAEAGHRLVADGLRLASRGVGSSSTTAKVDGAWRHDAQERRILMRLHARRRVQEALRKLSPMGRTCAESVCIYDRSLSEVAETLCVGEAEAGEAFTLALLRLAQYYGTIPGLGGDADGKKDGAGPKTS